MKNIKTYLVILILLINYQIFGQKVKHKNKISKNEYEIYYTDYHNPKIKIGEYKYYKNKVLRKRGYFINNLKDSLWTEYSYNGKRIKSYEYKDDTLTGLFKEYVYSKDFTEYKYKIIEGHYKNGKKDSIWITYKYYPENINKYIKSEQGYYKNGLKDGNYVYYNENGTIPLAVGKYSNDTMINKWKFYKNGRLIQVYDFNKDKLIYTDTSIVLKNKIITGGKYENLIFVEKEITYKNGLKSFYDYFFENLEIPCDLRKDTVFSVSASFQVNEDGSLSNIKILNSSGEDVNKEFFRIIKLTVGNWEPAIFNNCKVPSITMHEISYIVNH